MRASFECVERDVTITLAVSSHPHGGTVVSLDSVARGASALPVNASDVPELPRLTIGRGTAD